MKRRDFARTVLTYGGAPFLGLQQLKSISTSLSLRKKFPILKKGDKIALITPGSSISETSLEEAISNIKSLGFKPVLGKYIRSKKGYLAGSDAERLHDLHWAFSDDSFKAVWCARGGYGCTRLLPQIDYKLIRKNSKPFIGYSDVTALLMAFYKKAGLNGFHGPVGASAFKDYSLEMLQKVVLHPEVPLIIKPLANHLEMEKVAYTPYVIQSGVAEGEVLGGNLSILSSLSGTDYLPAFKNKIVFIEDIGEPPYRIDRMLVQLIQSTDLDKAAAIVFGIFANCEKKEGANSLTLKECLLDLFKGFSCPVIYGLPLGHLEEQCTLPIGALATLNSKELSLTIKESPFDLK